MKSVKIKYLVDLLLVFFLIFLFSCKGDFLTQPPKDQISADAYWKTAKDLRLYVNQFYPSFPDGGSYSYGIFGFEAGTDNLISSVNFPQRLAGTRTVPPSGGGWNFGNIRDVNYFLENYKSVGKEGIKRDEYIQYVGEAYFFRAYFYFNLVKEFGDVPYISKTLTPESKELYGPRTPRQQVIDSVITDLDKAINFMNSGPKEGGTRLNKEIAQLYKSRVCLYEGTWEKYHDGTVFGVDEPESKRYLQLAAEAAKNVIESGVYSLYYTGHPKKDYLNLFNRIDYSDNPEVMLWKKYDKSLNQVHNHQQYYNNIRGQGLGITKSLVDYYLSSDGKPIEESSLYRGDNTLRDVMKNRDLRLEQTVWKPGAPEGIENGDTTRVFKRSTLYKHGQEKCPTGYQLRKGSLPNPEQYDAPRMGTTGSILFRYAEVLLNYAEAKAELGTISQADIDMTINKLRDRVGMAYLNLQNIKGWDSNVWSFPNLSPIINEVRRERRVELALEGFRWDDLARWSAADELIIGKRPRGIDFDPEMYPDVDVGSEVKLNDKGYVVVYKGRLGEDGYQFDPKRDYLNPIPVRQLSLNENLEQNPGW